jgi:hypothetical protein
MEKWEQILNAKVRWRTHDVWLLARPCMSVSRFETNGRFLFFSFFVQVSALDVAWTILVISQIFSYRQLVWQLISTSFISLTTADARTRYILFNENTILSANGLAFTHTYKVLQEVKRHGEMTRIVQATSKADTWTKKEKKRNLPLVSNLDAVGGLSTNMRPL